MNTTELDKRIDQIREIKRMREELDKELATLEDEIKQAMIEQGVDELRGTNGKVTWKVQTRTSVDTKTLKKELPDVAARYSTTTSYKVFRIA